MADFRMDRRRRRRKDRQPDSIPRKTDDHHPNPSRTPVKILGLAKPSRVPESGPSSENKSSPVSDPHDVDHSTLGAGENTGDKGHVVVLSSSSDIKSQQNPNIIAQDGKSQVDDESSDARRHQAEAPNPVELHHYNPNKKSTIPPSIVNGGMEQNSLLQNKLAAPIEKQTKCKIIDESLQWCDSGLELMLDQTDFLVVGIIGLQGCGKSTLLSLLAGNSHQDAYRNYVFFPQSKETKEECLFQTTGVDMFISPERIIFLDTQPMLCAAVMDCLLRYERKIPSEYSTLSNYVEMQSMQILTFLLSVCNIILIADDWFIDVNLLRFIQDAEMLKPSQHSSSSMMDNSASKEDNLQFFPSVIFVHNKATREDFNAQTYRSMQRVLYNMFSSSKLRFRNGINMLINDSNVVDGIINMPPGEEKDESCDVNLLMLPAFEFYKCEPEWLQTTLPDYRGFPSFNSTFSHFRAQVFTCPRSPLTSSPLTEKNWYHFAARMWDTIKKSPLLADYNRLISN